jgi:hypothetical protein
MPGFTTKALYLRCPFKRRTCVTNAPSHQMIKGVGEQDKKIISAVCRISNKHRGIAGRGAIFSRERTKLRQ